MNTSKQTQGKKNTPTPTGKFESIFLQMDNAELKTLNPDSVYLKLSDFEAGEVRSFICTGKSDFTKEGETVEVICLEDREGNSFITGGTILMKAFSKVENFPIGCKIEYLGKKESPVGFYDDAKVYVL